MSYNNLIVSIEDNVDDIVRTWKEEITKSEYMTTYRELPDKALTERGKAVYNNLIQWLQSGASNKEIEQYFERIGAERNREGFPLTEVGYALYLSKKVFWSFSLWKEEITGLFDTGEAIEFMTVLNNYFDLGNFYIIRGYLKELFAKLDESQKFSKEELESYFLKGALYRESAKKIKETLYGTGTSIGVIR